MHIFMHFYMQHINMYDILIYSAERILYQFGNLSFAYFLFFVFLAELIMENFKNNLKFLKI